MPTDDDYEFDLEPDTDDVEARATPRVYPCNHRLLSGQKRCLGCGRTRNEIMIDGR